MKALSIIEKHVLQIRKQNYQNLSISEPFMISIYIKNHEGSRAG